MTICDNATEVCKCTCTHVCSERGATGAGDLLCPVAIGDILSADVEASPSAATSVQRPADRVESVRSPIAVCCPPDVPGSGQGCWERVTGTHPFGGNPGSWSGEVSVTKTG